MTYAFNVGDILKSPGHRDFQISDRSTTTNYYNNKKENFYFGHFLDNGDSYSSTESSLIYSSKYKVSNPKLFTGELEFNVEV